MFKMSMDGSSKGIYMEKRSLKDLNVQSTKNRIEYTEAEPRGASCCYVLKSRPTLM